MTSAEPIVDVQDIRTIEQMLAAQGTSLFQLMEKAGRALADQACIMRQGTTQAFNQHAQATMLCGNGNNGGDGWMAGLVLAQQGYDVHIVTALEPGSITAQPAADMAQFCIEHSDNLSYHIHVLPDVNELNSLLINSQVIIDAILGTGFTGKAIRAPFDKWVTSCNDARNQQATCLDVGQETVRPYVLAADVPSGMDAQTGGVSRPCIKADMTVTMLAMKPGLATPYAFAFAGGIKVAHIAPIDTLLVDLANQTNQSTHQSFATPQTKSTPQTGKPHPQSAFLRAENEDDDGYDPYSDRRPEPEPLFNRDPWA